MSLHGEAVSFGRLGDGALRRLWLATGAVLTVAAWLLAGAAPPSARRGRDRRTTRWIPAAYAGRRRESRRPTPRPASDQGRPMRRPMRRHRRRSRRRASQSSAKTANGTDDLDKMLDMNLGDLSKVQVRGGGSPTNLGAPSTEISAGRHQPGQRVDHRGAGPPGPQRERRDACRASISNRRSAATMRASWSRRPTA